MGGAGVGGRQALLSPSFTRGSREAAYGAGSPLVIPHTSKYREKELCGSAPYPALSQTNAMERGCCGGLVELVDVGA